MQVDRRFLACLSPVPIGIEAGWAKAAWTVPHAPTGFYPLRRPPYPRSQLLTEYFTSFMFAMTVRLYYMGMYTRSHIVILMSRLQSSHDKYSNRSAAVFQR